MGKLQKNKDKAKIIPETNEKPCKQCGKPTARDKLCSGCEKVVCDKCAGLIQQHRYCPKCLEKVKALQKLA
jgi:hypothetical protein